MSSRNRIVRMKISRNVPSGVSRLRLVTPEKVISWCDKATPRANEKAHLSYLKGLCLIQKSRIDEGLKCLAEALRNGHNTKNLRLVQARYFFLQPQYPHVDVIAEAEAVLALASNTPEAHWIRALCHYHREQFAEALAAIRLATNSTISVQVPSDSSDVNQYGRCYGALLYSTSNLQGFLDSIHSAWQAHFWIAAMLRSEAKYQDALAHYAKALLLKPRPAANKAACHTNRSNIFWELGDHESALVESHLAVQADPEDLLSLRARGIAYLNVRRYEDALADLTSYMKLCTTKHPVWFSRGICYLQLGRLQEAIDDFTLAIQNTPGTCNFFARAIAYIRKGNFLLAIDDLTKYLEVKPECMTGYKLRGQLLRYLSQQDLVRADIDFAQEESLRHAASSLPEPYSIYPELVVELVDFVGKLSDQFEDRQRRRRDF